MDDPDAEASMPLTFPNTPPLEPTDPPKTPELGEWPAAGKVVSGEWEAFDSDGSSGSDEESRLRGEVLRLRAELDAMRPPPRKKQRKNFKPGSPQIRYAMRGLQVCYNTHLNASKIHSDTSPGQDARALLVRVFGNFMTQLNEESELEDFDWRAVPDRPHAKKLEFIL